MAPLLVPLERKDAVEFPQHRLSYILIKCFCHVVSFFGLERVKLEPVDAAAARRCCGLSRGSASSSFRVAFGRFVVLRRLTGELRAGRAHEGQDKTSLWGLYNLLYCTYLFS